ncbi:MAG: DNA primase [Chloroflexi bacterium]|nr:DNA primase [Chloroflexota bacterium]
MDIVQLVGERVQLRKAGRAYKGLCPFHNEKTPSFTVDPDRRTYKCFGCGEFGDCFTWIEKMDGLEPVDALTQLAERAGVELTRRAPEARDFEKKLLAAHESAHFYFRQAYRGTEPGHEAAKYVAARGITAETVERFGIGYAPDLMDGLLSYLRKKGYSDDEAVTTGLISRNERGLFDRFRHRVMIPIKDGRGRIIAFAGRALRADQAAKYLNSPQTPLFTKGATLFALDLARAAIRKANEAVIVEGQFDAIACHQSGFDTTVASMGTALTTEQYGILDKMKIERAVVAFDADAAGGTAAEKRGRELLQVMRAYNRAGGRISLSMSLPIHVATLPAGAKDPDELARTEPARLRETLEGATPVLEFVIDAVAKRHALQTPDGRRRFLAETVPLLADEPDAMTRELYLGTLSRLTGVPQEQLRTEAAQPRPASAGRSAPGAPAAPETPKRKQTASTERYLMAELALFPEEAARIDLAPEDLSDPDHRAIFEHLSAGRPAADLPAHLAATLAALGADAPEHEAATDTGHAIEIVALRLREQNLRRRLGEKRAELARASDDEAGRLSDEIAHLADELDRTMKARDRDTVLRPGDMETE